MKFVRLLVLALAAVLSLCAQNAALMTPPRLQFADSNGVPLAGGQVFFYAAGSSTPQAAYTDATGTTALPNPVTLDASGSASIWLGQSAYKVVLKDINGVTIWTQDNVSAGAFSLGTTLKSSTGAALISYTATNGTTRTLAARLADAIDLKDYGAKGDGSTNDAPALLAALASNAGRTVYLPAGTYLLDNTAGVVSVANWSGVLLGEGSGTVLTCKVLTNSCLQFTNANGLTVRDLSMTFATAPGARNGSQLLTVNTSTNVTLSNLYLHDGPSSALNLNSDTHVALDRLTSYNLWANAFFLVNTQDVRASNLSSTKAQDAAFEVSQYDGQAGACSDITLTGFTSYQDFSGILVNSCKNVALSGFSIRSTYIDGIDIRQDATTTTAVWPDNVQIANGVLKSIGAMNAANSAVRAVRLLVSGTTPTAPMRVSFSGLRIDGTNAGANAVQIEADPFYTVGLSDIHVANAGGSAFDLAGGHVVCDNCEADHAQSYGFVIRSASSFVGSALKAYDVQLGGANTVAFQNASTATVFVHGLQSISDQTPSRVGVYDAATSGAHVFSGVNFLTADATSPTVTGNGSSGFYAATTTANGIPTAPGMTTLKAATLSADVTSLTATPQLILNGATNALRKLLIGYDTTDNYAFLQATEQGTANRNLLLNANGGNVLVGSATDQGKTLQVGGTSYFSGVITNPAIKATTGLAPVCVDTNGNLVKSASACTGN